MVSSHSMLAPTNLSAPSARSFCCNVGASFEKNRNKAGLGVVVKDNTGKVIQAHAERRKAGSAVIAELLALHKAVCMLANQYTSTLVEIQSDVAMSIIWVKGDGVADPWFVKALLVDIRAVLSRNANFSVKLVRRSANFAANFVAREALRITDNVLIYALNRDHLELLCQNDVLQSTTK